ncbi:hypothetical protein ACFY41_11785 [Streptomyces syringium]|uniref:hypothetical protein n=1 Tax=Streptomyces syringium TaxID=76729 RepID=UPI0036C02CF7
MASRRGACRRCGGQRRFWRRECTLCRRSRGDRGDLVGDAADAAVEFGAVSWIWRGLRGVVRALTD